MMVMVDMEIGNLGSVYQAFRRVGADIKITQDAREIEKAPAVVLPGVGAFRDGMESLRSKGLTEVLRKQASSGKPFFGICLGMQLLAEEGEEHGKTQGLGLIPGKVVRLSSKDKTNRVPNMGWCDVTGAKGSRLFSELPKNENSFYFAHSYHFVCKDKASVAATMDYEGPLTAALEKGNVYGVQFHPEKSQDAGLDLLASFVRIAEKAL